MEFPNNNHGTAVDVKNLTLKFGEFTAVNNISFEVKKGEIFGFLGANGAGKTTTIRILCGLLVPTSGGAFVGGVDVSKNPRGVKSKVGYMSQRFTLYEDLTVMENLNFAAALRKLDKKYFNKRLDELFELIDFTWPRNTLVKNLPAGILQQVALTAATLHDPEIVFLDEPTAGVTPAFRARFWILIRRLAEQGKTVFVTTHYMDEAEECERLALMRVGEIIAMDSPANLKKKSFNEPLFEITPPQRQPEGWLSKLRSKEFISAVGIYGMRYHARVKDEGEWKKYLKSELNEFESKRIEPSLEDVFIRLVEG